VSLSGTTNVPGDGAAILCPNHLSFFDSVFMAVLLDRPVHFIGKAEYLDSWTTRWLFPAMGMIPIDRDSGPRAMIALDAAADVLRSGALLCIYPEGSRSRDGRLHRGYTGAARLAAAVGCPVVPVGISGTAEIQPPGARLPRPRRRCSIEFGEQLRVDASGRSAVRSTTDELMRRIAHLSGQEYVASYTLRAPRDETTRAAAVASATLATAGGPALSLRRT
jgi:1-acyl-sn-glycerol-3-phosphate acyltransferase